jgi:hypothetical protein
MSARNSLKIQARNYSDSAVATCETASGFCIEKAGPAEGQLQFLVITTGLYP